MKNTSIISFKVENINTIQIEILVDLARKAYPTMRENALCTTHNVIKGFALNHRRYFFNWMPNSKVDRHYTPMTFHEAINFFVNKLTKPELIQINNHSGEYDKQNGLVIYGCAKIDAQLIRNIATQYMGNRQIQSVKLDSGVEITYEQAEGIMEYLENIS